MNGQNSHGYTVLGISLALALVVASFILGGAIKSLRLGNQTIMVKGYAEKNIKADLAVWSCGISIRASVLSEGYDNLQRDRNRVVDYLLSKGVKKEMISIGAVNSSVIYKTNQDGYASNIREGYQFDQTITITSKDVLLIDKLSTESSELIREGVEFQTYLPSYYYTKLNDLKIEMLGAATKDAQKRAETMADNSGSSVGGLKSAQQGVFQITSQNSTEMSDYGEYDLSSIDKTIKSVVTIEFYIK